MIKRCAYDFAEHLLRRNFEKQYSEAKRINQEKYLKDLLLHVYHNVPYYNRVFREIGIIKDADVDLSKFSRIPILTKEIMRKYHEELISKDYTTRRWYYNSSGGSTGEPTRFIQDGQYDKWIKATNKYYYQDMLGIDEVNVKKVILWGSERDIFKGSIGLKTKIINWLTNTVFLNSFKMAEEDMVDYIKIMNSYRPELIQGYAGSLYELCRYAEKKKLKIHTPKILVSEAETLSDEMREKIETIFGTKLYDFYGSRETSSLAGECKYGLIHIFMFNNYIEILDSRNQPVKEGEEGRVIVTALHNYAMPFIRYEIGDMAVLGPEKCECGNPLPTLKKITGRVTDYFIREDGTIVSGTALTLTFNLKDWVKAFQIIQEDYKKIKILIVRSGNVNESEKKDIEWKIKFLLGGDCKITWEFVDEIPKTKSGKYLYIKSLLWR